MILRPRQEQFVGNTVDAILRHRNTLGIAPTGAGKTVMGSAAIERLMRDHGVERSLFVQHRDELVAQNRKTFHALTGIDFPSGLVVAKEKNFARPVTFAMIQTLSRHDTLAKMPPQDLILIDEAHHAAASTYLEMIERARELNPNVLIGGLTATPSRADRKRLADVFNNVADQIQITELIRSGALVKPRTFVVDLGVRADLMRVKRTASDFDMSEVESIMDHKPLHDQVIEKWKEVAGRRQTVVFCSTVAHAQHVAEAYNAAGVSARCVDGQMPDAERKGLLRAFDRGDYQVIVNCAILTEGWDCQPVDCVVLLRPSSAASTMIQMIGRGLRKLDPERYPGVIKTDCVVLDFGTSILMHGSLEQDIDLGEKMTDKAGKPLTKQCPACGGIIPLASQECGLCDYTFPKPEAIEKETGEDGERREFVLREIDIIDASPFKWEMMFNGHVMICNAFEIWAMCIFCNDHYFAVGGSKQTGIRILNVSDNQALALATADDFMREHGKRSDAGKAKRWLHEPASEGQLKHMNWTREMASERGLTKYQAACSLTWKFNERGVRKKLETYGI